MKTSVTLIRKMGEFEVTQRTNDGMFDGTALLKQWNSHSNSDKRINDFLESKSTKEFINALKTNAEKSAITENQVVTKRRGIKGGTWMHPYLFIDFAMWMNPTFKVQVLKFVYDELIKQRNDAGDAYREMSAAVASIAPKKELHLCIAKVAQALNHICFGQHEKEIRNRQDETAMKELVNLEKEVTLLIKVGHIKSIENLIQYLRNKWNAKYRPAILS